MRLLTVGLSAGLLAACASAGDPGPLGEGERQYQRCYACHALDPAETGLSGPPLLGIVGRPAAAVPGFDYSPALRAAAARGLVWTPEALDTFIRDPESLVPGTSMSPTGMAGAGDRAALIAYLREARP